MVFSFRYSGEYTTYVRFLSVYLEGKLTWKVHMDSVCAKIRKKDCVCVAQQDEWRQLTLVLFAEVCAMGFLCEMVRQKWQGLLLYREGQSAYSHDSLALFDLHNLLYLRENQDQFSTEGDLHEYDTG